MRQSTQQHTYRSTPLAYDSSYVARLQLEEARDVRFVWQRPCLSKPVYHVLQQFIAWIQYLQHLSVHLLSLILAQRGLQYLTLAHSLGAAEGRAKKDQTRRRLEDALPFFGVVVGV
jgi:hypothetical protein